MKKWMRKEGEFEGKWPKNPFLVHKYANLAVWSNKKFTAFALFYRLNRNALYIVGGWRDRTKMRKDQKRQTEKTGYQHSRYRIFQVPNALSKEKPNPRDIGIIRDPGQFFEAPKSGVTLESVIYTL